MSDCKWTDGPWSFEYDNSDSMGGGQWFDVLGPEGELLLWCRYSAPDSEVEEKQANAHLISAAPELYKILSEYVETFSYQTRGHRIERTAKNALAKARGESQ